MLNAHDLLEMLCAAHLTAYVQSPFHERGGVMLVAPPGALKSTFIGELDSQYHDALTLTDLNAKALTSLRDRIGAGQIKTLVFPEYAKLYERGSDTASNLEGSIRALVAEGFTAAAFEPQGVARLRARCMVVGAMTPSFFTQRYEQWEKNGFVRRFLWAFFRLQRPDILDEAILEWRRLRLSARRAPPMPSMDEIIPNASTRAEREQLRRMVKYQPGGSSTLQLQVLVKILSVLRWSYERSDIDRDPMEVLEGLGEALGREGVEIALEPAKHNHRQRTRERERVVSHAGQVLGKAAQRSRQRRAKQQPVRRKKR